jgi:hypothetical protein
MLRTLSKTVFSFITVSKKLTHSHTTLRIPKLIIGSFIGFYMLQNSFRTNAIEDK